MILEDMNLTTAPAWFKRAFQGLGAVRPQELWVAFRNAPEAFSRVERVRGSNGVLLVDYAPEGERPLADVVAYRIGADGKDVDVMTGAFDRPDGRQKRETPTKPRTAKKGR